MTPTQQGVASVIARNMRRRPIVKDVYGPFAAFDGSTVYRVLLNNDVVMEVIVREAA